ncbi:MAG: HEAT repeat domain-containing protein [Coriobacteriia bacterium]|nr:HEAT repeat domain-containing protein [Coriobacteriia bacterium]MBN2847179.1 HEAT repeat domain-containing protein [Coriobacteriia bacterium]
MQEGVGYGAVHQAERAPDVVERLVKQLLVLHKAVKLYPPTSDIPRDSAADVLGALRTVLRERPDVRFQVTKDALLYSALPVLPGQRPFESFAREFYNRNVAEVRFHATVTAKQLIDFLAVLQEPPEVLHASGGLEQRLWDLQVDGVTVVPISTRIVDSDGVESEMLEESDDWPPAHDRIDELVQAAYGAHPRDQRVLVRVMQNPRLVSRYLGELASSGRTGRSLVNLMSGRVVSLAHSAFGELAEDQPALFRSIAESLLSLDPQLRRDILVERLLPDARLDEAIAGVLRQFELGELCSALVEGMSPDPVSRDGISRAIRNLAVISLRPKDEVLGAAETALREAGADETTMAAVLENAAPVRLRVDPEKASGNESVESVLRLVDLAPVAAEAVDEGVADIRAEVAAGITDGDIMLSMVTLAAIERRPDVFAQLMVLVEDGLGLLLEWGEYEAAADAAAAFAALERDETLDAEQRARVKRALIAMADVRHMRELNAALRRYDIGSSEYRACYRLMLTLGALTIGPLLEVLADEPDMAARKAMVDLISDMAPRHIGELADRISDPRWYFVRNVVAILGSTRRSEALPHLNRTLRHTDARVRRETIRAVVAIKDRFATEMLIAALADEDPQNAGLAARLLGTLGARGAFPALAAVARGDGRGNREPGVRIEAIEALGKLGMPEAADVLRDIVRQRGIMRAGRVREIKSAAAAALAAVERARAAGGA